MDENQQEVPQEISEGEYFIEAVNNTSESIISDEFLERNRNLVRSITDGFHDRDNRQGDMPSNLAGRALEIFFSSIAKQGLR